MEDNIPFNALDPLGPEFGRINPPVNDAKGLAPFEGNLLKNPKNNFPRPEKYFSTHIPTEKVNLPNRSIEQNVVKTNSVNPSIPKNPNNPNKKLATSAYLDSFFQANQDKNNYGKIYSYNAGPDGNAFYKRYAGYGQEKFDSIGFSPLRDNEANFNARTTRMDDFSRMMSHSFFPLLYNGFTAGPKSLVKMMKGDFTSSDLEEARKYEEAAAIGQSNKGGLFGFVNNATMNFGYTAGIILEAIAEEAAGALLAAPTGGLSLFAATANNMTKAGKIGSVTKSLGKGYDAVASTLKKGNYLDGARELWNAAKSNDFLSATGRALNPLENTMDAFKVIKNTDNITDLAALSKTAGGFYRDVRNINMALSEARLEGGMTENHVYDRLYNDAYLAKGEVPSNKELADIEKQAKDASYDTVLKNTALIYASNAITFNNITSPRGGVRNFMKNVTEDVTKVGSTKFGNIGKVVYDNSKKAFEFQKNNFKNLAKGWYKDPIYKSAKNTVGYFKANFSEGMQENLQEVIAGANEKYYIDTYKSNALKAQLYSGSVIDHVNKTKGDYYRDELNNQFSAQGAETFASGFFMGVLAGPLNNAVPFLSTGYNKMFNKEEYTRWKSEQTAVSADLVNGLNNMDLATFVSDTNLNLGSQDLISKIRQQSRKKEGLDAETESYVNAVNFLSKNGATDLFKKHLNSYKNATDEEFADAFKINEEDVPKYRARLEKASDRMERIIDIKKRVELLYPNPIQDSDLPDKDSPEYEAVKEYQMAWDMNTKNMVFFYETFDDLNRRRVDIQNTYTQDSNFQNINGSEKDMLFNPEKMQGEIDLITKELEIEKELNIDPKKIKKLNERLTVFNEYNDQYKTFDVFFNRAENSDDVREELSKSLKRVPTEEEIAEALDKKYGSLNDETIGNNKLSALKTAHDKYLKTLAKHNNDIIFDEYTDEAFEKLVDYYKLGHEKTSIAKYINVMNDPESFFDVFQRNQVWLAKFKFTKVKYFEDLIRSEIGKVRDNSLLNALADKGYYLNGDDMANFLGGSNLPPKEIFNNITKEIYLANSEKYNEIYNEFFKKRADLKNQQNPKKTEIVKKVYQSEIEKLEAERDDKISKLPTTSVRIEGEAINKKDKNIILNFIEIYDQLNELEYVEAKTAEDSLIFFKDDEGTMHYDDNEGAIVNFDDITQEFTEANKFSIVEQADPKQVKAIEDAYAAKITAVQEAYIKNKEIIEDEQPYEEITQETDLTTPDLLDFRNNLYSTFMDEYVPTLSEEEQNQILEEESYGDIVFENWYKNDSNKKYFDAYNKTNKPQASPNEITFSYEGSQINTKDKTLEELIRYRDSLNIAAEDDFNTDEENRLFKITLKNLNSIIQKRQFSKFSPVVKEGIKKIQKLLKAQEGVEEKYLLKEDDFDTGLKAGEVAYRVNGKIHRRVTRALQDVLGEDYVYSGSKSVMDAFNLTISKDGLNTDSIDDFIIQLNALLAIKSPGYDPLPGANKKLLDKLKDELNKLSGLSKEQINIEKSKDKILKQIENKTKDLEKAELEENEIRITNLSNQRNELYNKLKELDEQSNILTKVPSNNFSNVDTTKDIIMNFFNEETYQDSRDAGNFVDDAKDYLESGVKPKFDETKITKEAYDNLFDESTGYLTQIKRQVDAGDFYLIGRDLVVFDSNIMRSDNTIDRIAGEIDLLLATDDGIMIVDIKSGEMNKWMSFNKLSTNKDKKVYSKREEYTLQQGAYATMLEKMINAPVSKIALLPVERASDKETDQMVSAGKPESKSIYSELAYEKDENGNYKRNEAGELIFKTTNKKTSSWLIPLYRETVQDKLDKLFPQKTVKLIPGLTSMGVKQFEIYTESLNQISDKVTDVNQKTLTDLESKINNFSIENNLEIPEELNQMLEAKKYSFDKTIIDELINTDILKYELNSDRLDTDIAKINKNLEGVTVDTNFEEIDLSEKSPFIKEQLKIDNDFKIKYDTHFKSFKNVLTKVTEGQEVALNNLLGTNVITKNEFDIYKEGPKTRSSASELIHEAVKRIQYLIANSENLVEVQKLKLYQKSIFNLMAKTKSNNELKRVSSSLNKIKNYLEENSLNKAVSLLDQEILKLQTELTKSNLKDFNKIELERRLTDMQKLKTAISNLSKFKDVQAELEVIDQTEEGVIEEIELPEVDENIIKKDDVLFSKSGNFDKYTVTKINSDNTVELKDESDKKSKINMESINKDFINEQQALGEVSDVKIYQKNPSDDKVIKESLDFVDNFIKTTENNMVGHALGLSKTPEQIRKELIEKSKNCE